MLDTLFSRYPPCTGRLSFCVSSFPLLSFPFLTLLLVLLGWVVRYGMVRYQLYSCIAYFSFVVVVVVVVAGFLASWQSD